jgi:membrane protease YdiL (CAAX protease family)
MSVAAAPADRPEPRGARRFATRRPVLTLCLVAVGLSAPLVMAFLVAGLDPMPAKAAELVFLTGTAVLITTWIGGRAALRQLFTGLIRWRIGVGRWLLVLLAMPVLTLAVDAAIGTLRAPDKGWGDVALWYLIFLVFGVTSANLWEELAWAGFVQSRLTARHGLLRGALLTAVPVGLIHLPLAFEADGWTGTTWQEALVNTAWLLLALPFFRYLAGVLLTETKGSVLAVGVLHGSFNAAGAMAVSAAGVEYVLAVIVLALLVAGVRALHERVGGRSGPASPDRLSPEPAATDLTAV